MSFEQLNGFTLFMITFVVIGLPVILGVGGEMFRRWLIHKERMAQVLTEATAEKAAQYAAHTERLEARVRVLERIATDRGADVAAQIEQLRDDRLN
ncbi:hypothetical protein [Sphingomonas yunnanensis]|uniref:hypothetical protein n=1 Tax=Sphingomonas yunnanensis TaxID=310400 RepID=UPI001FEC877C|nr:hypothetical protein [Sphingomonas yunnanensis]